MNETPSPDISDDDLSAYLDGELSAERRSAVESALGDRPDLRRRLDDLERLNRLLRPALDEITDAPMPDGVLDLLKGDGPAGAASGGTVLPFRRWPSFMKAHGIPMAMAASLALVAGVVIGSGQQQAGSDLFLAAREDVLRALSTAPSAEDVVLDSGGTMQVIASFRAADGGYCREFAVHDPARTVEAIACNGDGSWQVKVAEFLPAGAAGEGYAPASGGGSALQAFADEAAAGDALDRDEEMKLIAAGWASED